MRKSINLLIISALSVIVTVNSSAQIKDVATMLSGSTKDAEALLQAYLKPYANAFGADLNGGWYNTAKPHSLLGFNITASLSAAFIPKADREYDASKLGLTGTVTGTTSQTVAGKKESGQTITYPSLGGLSYKTPKGTNWGIIPAPMFQLGIGIVKETDLTFRYVPNMNVGDFGSVGLWGIGVKHSLKQYIPGIKMAPFFHLSVFLGYTKMKTDVKMSFKPADYNDLLDPDPVDNTTKAFDNQKMAMEFKGFTGNILASFDLPVVTFYGGVGISSTNASLKLTGDYPLPSLNGSQVEITDGVTNPINIKMKSKDGSATKPRLNAGIKFKMGIIHLHFDYTYANYSVVTTGLGISFR